jgi:hypothetical protein
LIAFSLITVKTASGKWNKFAGLISNFLSQDTVEVVFDGKEVQGYRSPDSPALWIRDHSDILRAGRYQEAAVQEAVEAFALTQLPNGRIFDYVMTRSEEGEPENWEKWVRVPVESDVEYRFVKAAYLAWQATGDHDWIETLLPSLDQALSYTLSHEWRWDEKHELVKRPYTIDTWDFDYTAGRVDWLNFQITDDTFWGLFHGDNSGVYEAAQQLSTLHEIVGESDRAEYWKEMAQGLRRRANDLLFNGRFYTHFHKLNSVTIEGVSEQDQLSLSNPIAINRGLATHEMAVSILEEYRRRREETAAFAEWFSIDPPFPNGVFGDEKLKEGTYVNGGIMPLTGGELARAAFEHGLEEYGRDTLDQYRQMIEETGETYLWYFPDGTPSTAEASTSPEATPTDGWGSSAMLYAFIEGLCGIEDVAHSFNKVRCAPRWVTAGEPEAFVEISYAASGKSFAYDFRHDEDRKLIELEFSPQGTKVQLHVLLPKGARAESVTQGKSKVSYDEVQVEGSTYVDAEVEVEPDSALSVQYDL